MKKYLLIRSKTLVNAEEITQAIKDGFILFHFPKIHYVLALEEVYSSNRNHPLFRYDKKPSIIDEDHAQELIDNYIEEILNSKLVTHKQYNKAPLKIISYDKDTQYLITELNVKRVFIVKDHISNFLIRDDMYVHLEELRKDNKFKNTLAMDSNYIQSRLIYPYDLVLFLLRFSITYYDTNIIIFNTKLHPLPKSFVKILNVLEIPIIEEDSFPENSYVLSNNLNYKDVAKDMIMLWDKDRYINLNSYNDDIQNAYSILKAILNKPFIRSNDFQALKIKLDERLSKPSGFKLTEFTLINPEPTDITHKIKMFKIYNIYRYFIDDIIDILHTIVPRFKSKEL